MEAYFFWFLQLLPILVAASGDPSAGTWNSKQEARNLECRHLSQQRAHELAPGRVPPPAVRQTSVEIDALVCEPRIMELGERPARDEAILSSLRREVGELTRLASALGTNETTWHVDAFYPDARVAGKIAVTARTELAEHGRRVSDRVPLLAADDVAVLHPLPPQQAFPLACRRFFAERTLFDDQAFLAIALVDPRETQLHAGACIGGEWRWLQ